MMRVISVTLGNGQIINRGDRVRCTQKGVSFGKEGVVENFGWTTGQGPIHYDQFPPLEHKPSQTITLLVQVDSILPHHCTILAEPQFWELL